jgi:hypothetical protein
MGRYTDDDGIDGPFDAAMRAARREDLLEQIGELRSHIGWHCGDEIKLCGLCRDRWERVLDLRARLRRGDV